MWTSAANCAGGRRRSDVSEERSREVIEERKRRRSDVREDQECDRGGGGRGAILAKRRGAM
jgi:hypothetical protein